MKEDKKCERFRGPPIDVPKVVGRCGERDTKGRTQPYLSSIKDRIRDDPRCSDPTQGDNLRFHGRETGSSESRDRSNLLGKRSERGKMIRTHDTVGNKRNIFGTIIETYTREIFWKEFSLF